MAKDIAKPVDRQQTALDRQQTALRVLESFMDSPTFAQSAGYLQCVEQYGIDVGEPLPLASRRAVSIAMNTEVGAYDDVRLGDQRIAGPHGPWLDVRMTGSARRYVAGAGQVWAMTIAGQQAVASILVARHAAERQVPSGRSTGLTRERRT